MAEQLSSTQWSRPGSVRISTIDSSLRAGFREAGANTIVFWEERLGLNKDLILKAIERGDFDLTSTLNEAPSLLEYMPEDWLEAAINKWFSPEKTLQGGLNDINVGLTEKLKNGIAKLSIDRRKLIANKIGQTWPLQKMSDLENYMQKNTETFLIGERQLRECLALVGAAEELSKGMVEATWGCNDEQGNTEMIERVKKILFAWRDSEIGSAGNITELINRVINEIIIFRGKDEDIIMGIIIDENGCSS